MTQFVWWELGGEHRIKGAMADHPSPAESYRSALALWGLSIAGKRQLGEGRQWWPSPSASLLDMKRTEGLESPQTAGPMEAGFVVVCRPTAMHHGRACCRPTDRRFALFCKVGSIKQTPTFKIHPCRPLFLEFLLLAPENHPSNRLPLPDFFCKKLFPAISSSII